MKKIKNEEEKQTLYVLKLWGLHIPLAKPLSTQEGFKLLMAYMILLLLLGLFSSKVALLAAVSYHGERAISWVNGVFGQKPPRSP